ncbi:MAG: sigma 54-interacting transcriptional regulator [Thermodesulfobacteriota bacterium]|nr:sigma 54-interacting transcriptional regulator [Thermodesulfobacteriota bacterium]
MELLDQGGFLKTLFDAIPCGVLIVDDDRRVQAVNNVLERAFDVSEAEVIDKRGGVALNCIHASDSPEGCGYGDFCESCGVRNTALEALAGGHIYKNRADVHLLVNGKVHDLVLLVSAAPIEHMGRKMVIVLLEDITALNALRCRLKTEHSFSGIIGRNEKILELFNLIREVADVNIPVLIQGESGTGKELVASAIHNEGPRKEMPFVPVNCGALPEGLLESELFGHVKGAFTGAVRDKRGRFELAEGGTMFLDEVAELPRSVQVKLLRVLQDGTFERVGGEKTLSVDVRLISATNRNLKREVERNNFREDLYYRIKVIPIDLPPLRERRGDIQLLVDYFLEKFGKEGRESPGVSGEALSRIIDYSWPGNVRELQSALRFALVKSAGMLIQPAHLPPELKETKSNRRHSRGPNRKLDPERVRAALIQSGDNKAKAARILGVGRATLYRFLDDFPDALAHS